MIDTSSFSNSSVLFGKDGVFSLLIDQNLQRGNFFFLQECNFLIIQFSMKCPTGRFKHGKVWPITLLQNCNGFHSFDFIRFLDSLEEFVSSFGINIKCDIVSIPMLHGQWSCTIYQNTQVTY